MDLQEVRIRTLCSQSFLFTLRGEKKLDLINNYSGMKRILTALSLLVFLASSQVVTGQNHKVFTEADYQQAADMLGSKLSKLVDNEIRPQWLADGRLWYKSSTEDQVEYKMFNPENGKWLTKDSKAELFKKADVEEATSRRSSRRSVSPDGKYEAFIKDWNLWIKEVDSGEEKALTTDGVENFGYATDNAGWKHSNRAILSWSPDSKKIATFQQDQRHVSDMYLVKTQAGAPELMEWKYPLPSDEDIIRIHRVIIDIEGDPKVVRLQLDPDARRGTLCDDISCEGGFDDVEWSDDSQHLIFVSTSRDHKEAHVRRADCETGEVREIFNEIVATQYESGRGSINWSYLCGTNEIIWYSQRSDWGHLYMYDAESGLLKNQITTGNYVVRQVLKVDQDQRLIYYIGSGKEANSNPYYRYLYRVDFSGENLMLLSPELGDHSVRLSPDGKFILDTYSQADVPPVYEVRDVEGKLVEVLEKADVSRLREIGWKPPKPFTVKSANGNWDLYGLMYTPTKSEPGKKYPVILYIYPGPQGGSVRGWSFRAARGDNQALAELGFVVVALEGSCNPNRSKSFHDACYGNMGENTLPDQVSGLKQLEEQYDFMDLDRVGIWGHSGGGFATGAAMFKYPDFFKVGISESGNHDNRNYEDDWGERYNGLETKDEEGVSNYELQANQVYAKDLQGKLMIIHGGMDDNVPPSNTYLVVDALIKANKDFDLIILPNARHGYGRDGNYIMRRRWDYFVSHLLNGIPPKEFQIK
jgi:dipeptidyl aminopeptidase/acylaminoacyl peptidase